MGTGELMVGKLGRERKCGLEPGRKMQQGKAVEQIGPNCDTSGPCAALTQTDTNETQTKVIFFL